MRTVHEHLPAIGRLVCGYLWDSRKVRAGSLPAGGWTRFPQPAGFITQKRGIYHLGPGSAGQRKKGIPAIFALSAERQLPSTAFQNKPGMAEYYPK